MELVSLPTYCRQQCYQVSCQCVMEYSARWTASFLATRPSCLSQMTTILGFDYGNTRKASIPLKVKVMLAAVINNTKNVEWLKHHTNLFSLSLTQVFPNSGKSSSKCIPRIHNYFKCEAPLFPRRHGHWQKGEKVRKGSPTLYHLKPRGPGMASAHSPLAKTQPQSQGRLGKAIWLSTQEKEEADLMTHVLVRFSLLMLQ